MAIGDAVAAFLGTAATTRQPSSGVEEQISAIVKPAGTDRIVMYNGSTLLSFIENAVITSDDANGSAQRYPGDYNQAAMLTNSMYLQKPGTTDRIYIGGVQTNV